MREHAGALILVVAVSGGIFVNALRADFVWDDGYIILSNESIRDLRLAPHFFSPRYWQAIYADYAAMPGRGYRPVPEVSFALDYAIWKLNPLGFHLTNVLIHIANCVLVYLLAHRILRDRLAALLCALLFATHPVHVEAVVWVKARHDLLACAFMVLSALLYLRGVGSPVPERGAAPTARSAPWHLFSALAFGAAMLSKPTAVVLPGLLALYVWCFVPRRRARAALLGIVPLVGVMAVFFALNRSVPKVPHMALPLPDQVASGIGIMGIYLKLLVLPINLCLHHHFAPLHSLRDPEALRGIAFGIAMLVAAAVAYRRSKIAFFAIGWIAIALVPLCHLLLVGRPVADPRAYIPSVGFCILIALACAPAVPGQRRTASPPARQGTRQALRRASVVVCCFVVALYAGLTVARTLDWTDEHTLWTDTLEKNPHSWHAHRILAAVYFHAGDKEKALEHLEEAILIRPTTDYVGLHQAAQLYEQMGRWDEAIECRRKLVEADQGNVAERVSLGMLYATTGERTKALWQLNAALGLAPNHPDAHYNVGVLHANDGDHARAIPHFEKAAAVAPDRPLVQRALAIAYEAVGRYEPALAAYDKCLALQPENADAWLAAGWCHERLGQPNEATRRYRRCLELGGPAAAEARRRLAEMASGVAE